MIVWVLFLCMITVFLALDLGIFNREAHEISYKEATKWTIAWSTLGVLFSGMIYLIYSNQWIEISAHTKSPLEAAIQYLTGYIIELTLSIDNIFVIAIIFKSFRIPLKISAQGFVLGYFGCVDFSWSNDCFWSTFDSAIYLDHLCIWGFSDIYGHQNGGDR